MFWLIRNLRRDFRTWDRATRLALIMALVLLAFAFGLFVVAPPEQRPVVLGGAFALLTVIEITVLWGNRTQVTPFTQAQRRYLDGDFDATRRILEAARAAAPDKIDARALTLLGNTYRQLGLLDESETVLYEALDKTPNHHFPRYGFGRTLLSKGRYDEAAVAIHEALEAGAPQVVTLDLAEAYARAGRDAEARTALAALDGTPDEAYRALMAGYLAYRLGIGDAPQPDLIRAGLAYWEASAERFAHTPYGKALGEDVHWMREHSASA